MGKKMIPGFVLAAVLLLFAFAAKAETTNGLSAAEIQGRQLAQQLCAAQPAENYTNTGVLTVRDGHGKTIKTPIKIEVMVAGTIWSSWYDAGTSDVKVIHDAGNKNEYRYHAPNGKIVILVGNQTMVPFAGSDFWIADLGLEFLHWPAQKVLPKTTNLKRGRSYTLLESTNPNPSTNGYSRVLTWIDQETGGILEAKAYDALGKDLKEFYPKDFKKVNGQQQLEMMEMDNVQTDSRTRIEFDLKK